eukprot:TRINITY_DN2695_c0_g1_i1.p1 TRINITY_DN2695_c0_g1~~TRINITY_DN2695_c0_g1_i1.p1  ORF type:complete len:1486 (+),score=324.52 TRINITY_DN2695_c0_g1_i1:248-4459(+)
MDVENIYGSNELAMKASGHDFESCTRMFGYWKQGLHVPFSSIIDYRGYRLLVMSILPINKEKTLIYGSSDSGYKVSNRGGKIDELVRTIGQNLGICEHVAGIFKTARISGPSDLEIHMGTDNKLYCLDFARICPPRARTNYLTDLFRHEFLSYYSKKFKIFLNSDVYSNFSKNDPQLEQHKIDNKNALKHLREYLIPNFLRQLDYFFDEHIFYNKKTFFTQLLHNRGINVRFLGRLRNKCSNEKLMLFLDSEMICRIIKNIFREELRNTVDISQQKQVASNTLNSILHLDTDFWKNIEVKLKSYFERRVKNSEKKNKFFERIVHYQVEKKYVFLERLIYYMSITLKKGAMSQLYRSKLSNDFFFSEDDIKLDSRLKHFHFVDIISAELTSSEMNNLIKKHKNNNLEAVRPRIKKLFYSSMNYYEKAMLLYSDSPEQSQIYKLILDFCISMQDELQMLKSLITLLPISETQLFNKVLKQVMAEPDSWLSINTKSVYIIKVWSLVRDYLKLHDTSNETLSILRYFINMLNSTRETKKSKQRYSSSKFRTNLSQVDSHLSIVRREATQLYFSQKFRLQQNKGDSPNVDSHYTSLSLKRTPTLNTIKGIVVTSSYLCLNGCSIRNICHSVLNTLESPILKRDDFFSSLFTNKLKTLEISNLFETHIEFDYELIFRCSQLTSLSISSNCVNNNIVKNLLMKLPKLIHFDFSNCIGIVPDDLFNTFKQNQFTSLKSLNISGINIRNGHLKKVLRQKKLEKLVLKNAFKLSEYALNDFRDLTYLDLEYSRCKDENLDNFAKNCPNLVTLILNNCFRIQNLSGIAIYCKKLEILELKNCFKVNDESIEQLTSNPKDSDTLSNSLICLNLSGCSISNEGVEMIGQRLKMLVILNLSKNSRITSIAYVTRKLKRLRFLLFEKVEGHVENSCSENNLCEMVVNGKSLDKLDLDRQNLTDKVLYLMSENCTKLRSLSINSCFNISDIGMKQLLSSCSQFENLNLKRLTLSEQTFQMISEKCKFLQHLEITLSTITNKSLSSILMNCNYLRTLIVTGDSKAEDFLSEEYIINDNAFSFLKNRSENFFSCTTLQYIDFSGLKITSKSVKWLTKVAQHLQAFNLSNCNLLGDKALFYISQNCKYVEAINIGGCNLITDAGIEELTKKCKFLRLLGVEKLDKLTYESLNFIRECKYLSQLFLTIQPEWLNELPCLVKVLESTFEDLHYLSSLSLSGTLNPHILETIYTSVPTLKSLEIKQSSIVKEKDNFGSLGNLSPSLKRLPASLCYLKIVGSDFLDDESIKCVCKVCPELIFLQIEGTVLRLSKNALSPLLSLNFLRSVEIQSNSIISFVHEEILKDNGVKVEIRSKKLPTHTTTVKSFNSYTTIIRNPKASHLQNPLFKYSDFNFVSLQDEEDCF